MTAFTTTRPLPWCALCGLHHVASTEVYCCPGCDDPGLDVPKPVKPIAVIPGPRSISRLAASGFAHLWGGGR